MCCRAILEGRSVPGKPCLQAVAERLPVSIELMLLAEIIGLAIGRSPCDCLRGAQRQRFRPLHDRYRLRQLSVPAFPVRDPV